ncbi:hypothetical protein ASL22_10885 [Alcaligenes faecalis]|nr:hypothetical protein ASL22_10885 [Alcaligenes faecalis]
MAWDEIAYLPALTGELALGSLAGTTIRRIGDVWTGSAWSLELVAVATTRCAAIAVYARQKGPKPLLLFPEQLSGF